jgi:hypothetical protein
MPSVCTSSKLHVPFPSHGSLFWNVQVDSLKEVILQAQAQTCSNSVLYTSSGRASHSCHCHIQPPLAEGQAGLGKPGPTFPPSHSWICLTPSCHVVGSFPALLGLVGLVQPAAQKQPFFQGRRNHSCTAASIVWAFAILHLIL